MIISRLYFLVNYVCVNNYFKRKTRILNCHIKMSTLESMTMSTVHAVAGPEAKA